MNTQNILSIDIGIHNIGYAIYNKIEDKLDFGLYDIDSQLTKSDKKNNTVITRVKYVSLFIDKLFESYNFNKVIVERQVNNNTMAMELMYSIVSCVYKYCKDIIIFDPKMKFKALGLTYSTKNKAHKKLSVNIVSNYINKYYSSLMDKFDDNTKQDDISDAILMLLIDNYKNDINELMKIKNVINN